MKVVAKSYFDVVGSSQDEGLLCEDASLAVQASRDECDINTIVKKYLRTGELPGIRQGVYADISDMVDLRDAMHMVNDAQQAFMALPADVRREFDNDPVKLVEFAMSQDPKDHAKAVALGLANPKSDPKPADIAPQPPVEAVPPTVT